MIRTALAALLALAGPTLAAPTRPPPVTASAMRDEVIYHIFVRSFRDSNGDRIGDLNGITESLDYLKGLGVTSLLLTPLQPSPYYHNYFATDFAGIDPAYGTMADFTRLVRAVRAHGMRIYLDQEIQYVADGHPWLEQARAHPGSRYSKYILWNRPRTNEEAEPFLNQPAWPGWDGRWIGIAMVDLRSPPVKAYFRDLFVHWIDPHGDGSLIDGIDGFRIDHMMDDLDNKHRETHLFADFWAPIFAAVKARNPSARILAEQADWGYGEAWLTAGHADMVFGFPLRAALAKMDKPAIVAAIRGTDAASPPGKSQILFLENHDTERSMSTFTGDQAKARIAATAIMVLKGTPLIYYGQELGMRGKIDDTQKSDAAHIGLREAMRWQPDLDAPESAIWYAGDHPAWRNRFNRSGDGLSVEEEEHDPDSLLAFYRKLLALRALRSEWRQGDQRVLCDDASTMLCMLKTEGEKQTLFIANLGATAGHPGLPALAGRWIDLLNRNRPTDTMSLQLAPGQMRLLATP